MKAIILNGGYATRLYPLTINQSKGLLPVRGKPVIEYLVEKLEDIEIVDGIIVTSNSKFFEDFVKYSKSRQFKKPIKILDNGSTSNENRLGLGDLTFAIEKECIEDDVIVLNGDLYCDFDLRDILKFFEKVRGALVGLYDIGNFEDAKKFGIIELENDKVKTFEEKPENPKSTNIVAGIYLFPKGDLGKIFEYIKTDGPKEGPAHLIPYLMKKSNVYGFAYKGNWYDIGNLEQYEELNRE